MGETVCEAVSEAEDMELAGRADPSLEAPLTEVLGDADVVVDFTTPASALDNVRECLAADVHAVVGTTGFELDQLARRSSRQPPTGGGRGCSRLRTSRSARS